MAISWEGQDEHRNESLVCVSEERCEFVLEKGVCASNERGTFNLETTFGPAHYVLPIVVPTN